MLDLSFCEFKDRMECSEDGKLYLQKIEDILKESRGLKRDQGFEIHHIHPRGLGGSKDSAGNLIKVTTYEHCLLHVLLARAFPCLETLSPILKMTYGQVKKLSDLDRVGLEEIYRWSELRGQARKFLSKKHKGTVRLYDPRNEYRWLLVKGSEELSARLEEGFVRVRKVCMYEPTQGLRKIAFPWQVQELKDRGWIEGSPKRGPVSEEIRKKLSESHKGGTSHLGIPVSQETRAKIAETLRKKGCRPPSSRGKRRLYLIGSSKFILVKPEEMEEYLKKGYETRKSGYVKTGRCSATGKVWIHKEDKDMRVFRDCVESFLKQGYELGYSEKHRLALSKAHKDNVPWNKGTKKI